MKSCRGLWDLPKRKKPKKNKIIKTNFSIAKESILWVLVLAPILFVLFRWAEFPDRIPMHWNIKGEVDRYEGKWGVFLLPAIGLFIYLLLLIVPKIDPRKKNYDQFSGTYWNIRLAVGLMLCLLSFMILLASLGVAMNIGLWLMSGATCLFLFLGNMFGKLRSNYFLGIRTPWTLENETVWMRTHRLAGKIWVFGSLIMLPLVFLLPMNNLLAFLFFAYVVVLVIIPVVYSWKISKENQQSA
jgi:uncharacterized membrane protein